MLKESTGFRMIEIPFFPGRPEIFPHFLDGDFNYIIRIQDRYVPLKILEGVFDTIVNPASRPHIAVFKILEDIDLSGSLRRTFLPPAPVGVIVEIILSGAGFKYLISRFGP
jgi:hypothetical protein